MARQSQDVKTTDGRTLHVAQWGDPGGIPLLSMHGTPGSRLSRPPNEQAVRDAGIRLITYDRPGYGGSDRDEGRKVVDCVRDVEAISDALGVSQFVVTGRSGGGPHALAVAAGLPDRVAHAECVVGPAPFQAHGLNWTAGMDPENVEEFGWAGQGERILHDQLTRIAATDLERMTADSTKVFSDNWQLADSDRQVLDRHDVQQVLIEAQLEALRPGVWGWVDDDLAFLDPWGFDLDDIHVPVTIRYGSQDVMVPAAHGAWLADHIRGATVVIDAGAGHFPTPEATIVRMVALAAGVS